MALITFYDKHMRKSATNNICIRIYPLVQVRTAGEATLNVLPLTLQSQEQRRICSNSSFKHITDWLLSV